MEMGLLAGASWKKLCKEKQEISQLWWNNRRRLRKFRFLFLNLLMDQNQNGNHRKASVQWDLPHFKIQIEQEDPEEKILQMQIQDNNYQ